MRYLRLDICDYTEKIVCPLYDSLSDVSGQATDVFILNERNGWKELSFSLPSVIETEDGKEDNYRLDYIITDYLIRAESDKGIDWYILSEDGVRHEAFSKKVSVVAGHVSKLLKNKSLDLEFSDDNGNNVGTVDMFLETILQGTDWKPGKIATFYEDDGITEKIRSLNAPVKTGAFKLIEDVCDKFEAKPVYNGDKTIDILPMNPFSDLEPGTIPDAVYPGAEEDRRYLVHSNVIELHYDKAVKGLERKRNSDNIATRLYGYGSYGSYVEKYCSIQTAEHEEYLYTITEDREGEFEITDGDVKRYFWGDVKAGDKLVWSMLDWQSRRYVWNETQQIAYKVYEDSINQEYVVLDGETTVETNYFPYLSDYTYYEEVGLLTDEMFQAVAKFQRDMVKYYKQSIEAQDRINELNELMAEVGLPRSGYLKLDIEKCEAKDTGSVLTIKYTDEHPDGVLFRSDYLEAEKDYFDWHVAQSLKDNGDPLPTDASIVYVLHKSESDEPIQWECAYLKDIDGRTYEERGKTYHSGFDYSNDEGYPKQITLWKNIDVQEGDSVYLFCVNNITGKLGAKFSHDESIILSLESQTKIATEKHPTYFISQDEKVPSIDFPTYGWCYQYDSTNYDEPGVLKFCWAERGDTKWMNAYVQQDEPKPDEGAYFLSEKYRLLWHCEDGQWVKLESVEEKKVAQQFGIVFLYCRQRDEVYKGLYENYTYTTQDFTPVGNYAFPSEFGYYWLFSTDQVTPKDSVFRLDTINGYIYQDDNVEHIVTPETKPYNTLVWPQENDLDGATFFEGSVYVNNPDKNGTDMITDHMWRSNYISVWPNETYEHNLPEGSLVVFYDEVRTYLGYVEPVSGKTFNTISNIEYDQILDPDKYVGYKKVQFIKVVVPKDVEADEVADNYYLRLVDYDQCCFCNDKKYTILKPLEPKDEEPVGINSLMRKFSDLVDEFYFDALPKQQEAQRVLVDENQKQVELLGNILREGWQQDSSYVQGDEERLYTDVLDNLKKIARPEVNYTFEFLDLYGSNQHDEYALKNNVEWPDIEITDAAHLVDPEMKINQWAYIDKLNKCYDQPWKTTIEINTQLTLMGQHEFKDVMTRIAEVASETKAKQTVYSRAEVISPEGTIEADTITGEIDTAEVQLTGGVTGWKTDDKGNMVLESPNGLAAIRLSGSGLFVANSKTKDGGWDWQFLGDGYGLNADHITYGTLEGDRIKAHSITTEKLMASIGNELDIGSNKALNLFATIDGQKPSGALKTTDALIEIKAGDEDKKASINVLSGGEINMESGADMNLRGGTINLNADSEMNISSGSKMNVSSGSNLKIESGSNLQIESGGNLKIESGGVFEIDSENFKVDATGMVSVKGEIEAQSGTVGGWHVDEEHIGNAEKTERSSVGFVSPTDSTDTVFWAGNTTRTNAPFQVDASGNMTASSGTVGGWHIGTEHLGNDSDLDKSSVGLYSGAEASSDVVIWAGSRTREDAPFKVKANGEVLAKNIKITGGTVSSVTGTASELTVNNGTITSSNISLSTVVGSNISGGSIQRTPIKNGPIENEEVKSVFNVTEDGEVTITKGEINFEKMQVKDTGSLKAADADLSGEFRTRCGYQDLGYHIMDLDSKFINQETLHQQFDNLKPVRYELDEKTRYGLVYEDVLEVYPDLTRDTDNSVTYIDFIAILIKEVQALRKRVAALEGS